MFTPSSEAGRPGGYWDTGRARFVGPEEAFVRMAWNGRYTVAYLLECYQKIAAEPDEPVVTTVDKTGRTVTINPNKGCLRENSRRWLAWLDLGKLKRVEAKMEPHRPARYRAANG